MARINRLSSSSRGAIAELIAGADLMLRGFEVYRNFASCGSTDLIAAKGNQFWRVQVKSRQTVSPIQAEWDLLARVDGTTVTYSDFSRRLPDLLPFVQRERCTALSHQNKQQCKMSAIQGKETCFVHQERNNSK